MHIQQANRALDHEIFGFQIKSKRIIFDKKIICILNQIKVLSKFQEFWCVIPGTFKPVAKQCIVPSAFGPYQLQATIFMSD